jgi:hypothetical protein
MSFVEVLSDDIIEVSVEPNPLIEVETFPGGIVIQGGTNLSLQYQLILGRLVSQPQLYREVSYTDGNVSAIDAWSNTSKTTKIFEIRLSYQGNNVTQKILTDVQSVTTLTVTYAYTNNNITSITEIFS